jgi:3-oxoacyl-[acyl-carrier-protein] synthase II
MKRNRIVITGIGVVSPIGIGKEAYWQALFAGKSAAKPITLFKTDNLKVAVGGEITEFNPSALMGRKVQPSADRAAMLLITSAAEAIKDSGLQVNDNSTARIGMVSGTTLGTIYNISEFDKESLSDGPRFGNPSTFTGTVANAPSSKVAIHFKIKGFNTTISTGMCASLDAIDYGRNFLDFGRADTVLAGFAEDFNQQTFLGYYQLGYLSGLNGGEPLSRPFDRKRDGILFSEGAGMIVMEQEEYAKANNRKIYAEVLGTGSIFDPAKQYRYNPGGNGMEGAMEHAIKNAGIRKDEIDCIFSNANSTKDADRIETKIIKKVFGKTAGSIPVTAVKSMLGETFSASGGLAVVAAVGALESQAIPPTINFSEKDPECDLNYVVNNTKKNKLEKIMINSFGPNGSNTSVIIGRYLK